MQGSPHLSRALGTNLGVLRIILTRVYRDPLYVTHLKIVLMALMSLTAALVRVIREMIIMLELQN